MALRVVSLRKLAAQTSRSLSTAAATASSFPDYVLKAPSTDVTTLDNGLRVASEAVTGSGTATVNVCIDAGSRYESAATNGAANLLEKLSFHSATGKRSSAQLKSDIEAMGGHFTASTSREQTVYSAQVLAGDVGKAVDLFSDVLLSSKLEEGALECERQGILTALAATSQEEFVLEHLHSTAFQGTGLGQSIAGTEESVAGLTKANLEEYVKTHYTAPRMVISGAGAVDHSQLCDLASQHFGGLASASSAPVVSMDPAAFTGSDYRVRYNADDTATIALAYESAAWTSEYAFPLMLMQKILGSYDRTDDLGKNHASRLCQEIAENDLAHSMSAFNTCYKDTGLFGVYVVCPDIQVDDCMWTLMNNLVRLVHTPSDEEVERAKWQLKASVLQGVDGTASVANDIGRQLLAYGRRMTLAEIFARIDSVSTADVKATAAKFINDQDHALAAVGGIHELGDYNWFRRHSYWLRY